MKKKKNMAVSVVFFETDYMSYKYILNALLSKQGLAHFRGQSCMVCIVLDTSHIMLHRLAIAN